MLRTVIVALALLFPGLALAGPNTLAVLYFDNSGNAEYDALKVGLAQMLINDLVGTDGVTVVERTEIQAILDELELGHSGMVDPNTAAKVGSLLGAEWLVMGTYFEMAGTLYVQSRIVKVETGEILQAHSLQDDASAFLTMEQELAAEYQRTLRGLTSGQTGRAPPMGAEPPTEPTPTRSAASAAADATVVAPDADTLQAAIAFSEGLIYLDSKDVSRAREAFEKAVEADPRLDDAKEQLAALEI